MHETQWERAEKIFLAGEGMLPLERDAYWRRACGTDQALYAEVQQLWQGQQRAEENDFLSKAAWQFNSLLGQDLSTAAATGHRLGKKIGPYELKRLIGSGGMGDVYLAVERQPHFSREVVVKLMKNQLSAEDQQRFQDEIRILARLEHENIARMYNGGSEAGQLYLVMEYLRDAVSLRDYLLKHQALPLDTVVSITKQVCAGFGAAHAQGIVHRDVKPENIMIRETPEGLRAIVIDFGIAIPMNTECSITLPRRIPTKGIRCTPQFMSPEQALGKTRNEIDERSDIYSLGLVIYEMLTGALAFDGSLATLLRKQAEENPVPPRVLNAKINSAVNRVILKALAKDPAARQQSMAELAQELSEAAQQLGQPKRHPRWLAVAAALTIVLGGWLAYARYAEVAISSANATPSPAVVVAPAAAIPPAKPSLHGLLSLAVFQQAQGKQSVAVATDTLFRNSQRGAASGGVRIATQAAHEGYLYILEEGDAGQLNILYPHPRNPASAKRLIAGQQVFLPNEKEWFRFEGAAGTDEVYVLFAKDQSEALFAPLVAAVKARRTALAPDTAAPLLAKLRARAAALDTSAQGVQKLVTGAGPLVGVLKLHHQL